MPRLSIITVNLNNKAGLIDTAESIIAQTWTDYEWIIIDGGSTDGSVDVIKEYAGKTDKLVYWCSEPDGGIYQGMNKGIEKASGEYCWFLNSGDYAYKNTTLAEIFTHEFDEDIVYGDVISKYDKNIYKYEFMIWSPQKVNANSPFYWVVAGNSLPHSGGTLFSKKSLEKANGYEVKYKTNADKFLYMVLIFKFHASTKYVPVIMAFFDREGISSRKETLNISKRNLREFTKILFPDTYKILQVVAYIRYKLLYCIPVFFLRAYNALNKVVCFITSKRYLRNNKGVRNQLIVREKTYAKCKISAKLNIGASEEVVRLERTEK